MWVKLSNNMVASLFKKAEGVVAKRFNSVIKTQVFLTYLGRQGWLQQSQTFQDVDFGCKGLLGKKDNCFRFI